MKKPPDKYKTLKISLKQILKKKDIQPKLFSAITRTNKLVIHVYQFLKLWILYKYHNNENIPIITTDLIKMIFKTLITASSGPKAKGTNGKYLEKFTKFYNDEYSNLGCDIKLNGTNLSQIIKYTCTDMLTNIENNIKLNFISYIKRYVNSSFKKQHDIIIDGI